MHKSMRFEYQHYFCICKAMNGSVVSSVTDKFGFLHEEGGEAAANQRTAQETGHSIHNDLEILRQGDAQTIDKVSGASSSSLRIKPAMTQYGFALFTAVE